MALLRSITLAAIVAACTQPVAPGLPWLRGGTHIASTTEMSASVLERMEPYSTCDECTDYGGFEVVADVAPVAGKEKILASYARGVIVLDTRGRLVARSRGWEASGSTDEVLALAVVDAGRAAPLIAVAVRTGGRREFEVRLELLEVKNHSLAVVFRGVVEEYDDDGEQLGSVTIAPDGIHYFAPRANTTEVLPL